MNSIREALVAFDTNVYVYALLRDPDHPHCQTLLFEHSPALRLVNPLQVYSELNRNLNAAQMNELFDILTSLRSFPFDFDTPSPEAITKWEERGAKKVLHKQPLPPAKEGLPGNRRTPALNRPRALASQTANHALRLLWQVLPSS